jgi:hypothetical protein
MTKTNRKRARTAAEHERVHGAPFTRRPLTEREEGILDALVAIAEVGLFDDGTGDNEPEAVRDLGERLNIPYLELVKQCRFVAQISDDDLEEWSRWWSEKPPTAHGRGKANPQTKREV